MTDRTSKVSRNCEIYHREFCTYAFQFHTTSLSSVKPVEHTLQCFSPNTKIDIYLDLRDDSELEIHSIDGTFTQSNVDARLAQNNT